MLVVGLTGGVGMGKSTVAEFLRARGERIIDTDVLARKVVEPGTEALEEIKVHFGRAVLTAEGCLDRAALAREVFADPERRALLERIVHPRIRALWKQAIDAGRAEGKERAIVVIPLLFETGAQEEMHRTVCVACSPGVQLTRLRERGWTVDEMRGRVAAQWPITRKMEMADGVIWNESSVEVCKLQAARLFD